MINIVLFTRVVKCRMPNMLFVVVVSKLVTPKVILSYLWVSVSQRQGKICITELISGTLYRFFSYNVYGNGVESIRRDIMNVYEIYGLCWI